jgi:hypothetical protein
LYKIYGTNDITSGSALTLLIENMVSDNTISNVYVYSEDEHGTIEGARGVVMHDIIPAGGAAP